MICISSTDEDVIRRFARIVGHNPVHGPFRNDGKNLWRSKKSRRKAYKPVWKWSWSGLAAAKWAMDNFGRYLGKRRLSKLKEAIRVVESAPYKTENIRRAYLGIKTKTRVCTGPCGKEQTLKHFTGNRSRCRPCTNIQTRAYYHRRKSA